MSSGGSRHVPPLFGRLACPTSSRLFACRVMLCAAVTGLADQQSLLWRTMRFQTQASASRPLSAHLMQICSWAAARKPHLRSLTLSYSHTADPGFVTRTGYDWFCRDLPPDALLALLILPITLCGAAPLAELRLEIHGRPLQGASALIEERTLALTELPGAFFKLPALEVLHIYFPRMPLVGSLAHLTRLHTLSLHGVELSPDVKLPASLTALEGCSAHIDEWNSTDAIVQLPRHGAAGLRSLVIKGGSDEQGTRPLFLGGLSQLGALTYLSIEGPELRGGRGEEEEGGEEAEEDEQTHGAQLSPPLRQMAHLQALERLRLYSVAGMAAEGHPLTMPCWPALRVGPHTPPGLHRPC